MTETPYNAGTLLTVTYPEDFPAVDPGPWNGVVQEVDGDRIKVQFFYGDNLTEYCWLDKEKMLDPTFNVPIIEINRIGHVSDVL